MLISDFKDNGIEKFTPDEIVRTGATLASVQVFTMIHLNTFRLDIDRATVLLSNGLTTGDHRARWHPLGFAVDGAFREGDGPVLFKRVLYAALQAGFHGIGIYHNGTAYSFHFDLRPDRAIWVGWKMHGEDEWHLEYEFLIDPALFATGAVNRALLG